MSLSIIIPTFDSIDFFEELFNSINNNKYDDEFEVLIGIDNCEKTLEYVKTKEFPKNYFFYYFTENGGPYIIKNTLAEQAKYDKIFFFDSDDIMLETLIDEIDNSLDKYDCVKPKFLNFKDYKGQRNFSNDGSLYGEGVFGIKKDLFLSMNGFEGWKVAADSDFMGRIYKFKRKINLTSEVLFHRRLHNNSLTRRKDTGYASQMRANFFKISKNKKGGVILDEMKKGDYQVLDIQTNTLSQSIIQTQTEEINLERELKEKKHKLLESIFSDKPRPVNETKQPKTIDYTQVNRTTNHQTSKVLTTALKKAKLENLNRNFGRR
jgi:glycosyltransferase involved in cell wall biosynthesis